jgi:hypothetical protein
MAMSGVAVWLFASDLGSVVKRLLPPLNEPHLSVTARTCARVSGLIVMSSLSGGGTAVDFALQGISVAC